MRPPLFEAVPNFSEGKDATKISRITEAVRAISGVRILGLHSDPDHNRSVLTFAGGVDSVLEGAIALAKACVAELDLASQSGVHPRMGVLDVLPFVPLEGANMDDAVRLAHRAGESLGSLGIPVYLYGSAATTQHRRSLPDIRRGGYEGVSSRLEDPLWKPDYGPKTLDPHRGVVAVGARPFLVAFNAYLDTDDVEVARDESPFVAERHLVALLLEGAPEEVRHELGRAAFVEPPKLGDELPPVRITLPDSSTVTSDSADAAQKLSSYFGRNVRLTQAAPADFTIDMYHPDIEEAEPATHRDIVVEQKLGSAYFAEAGLASPVPVGACILRPLPFVGCDKLNAQSS